MSEGRVGSVPKEESALELEVEEEEWEDWEELLVEVEASSVSFSGASPEVEGVEVEI